MSGAVMVAVRAYSWMWPEIGWRPEVVVDGETVKTYSLNDLRSIGNMLPTDTESLRCLLIRPC
ncbi:MAG: hypothetical protein OEY99_06635 [Aigarchaeota archaeon]|nr:hypothetical protein [Aigarchaeota archaeon]MDH5703874.1 hypothetical protein [Aigarchaeota archaeon]